MGWQWHQLNHMQAICTSLQKITTPAPHTQMLFLTPNQQHQSTEGNQLSNNSNNIVNTNHCHLLLLHRQLNLGRDYPRTTVRVPRPCPKLHITVTDKNNTAADTVKLDLGNSHSAVGHVITRRLHPFIWLPPVITSQHHCIYKKPSCR